MIENLIIKNIVVYEEPNKATIFKKYRFKGFGYKVYNDKLEAYNYLIKINRKKVKFTPKEKEGSLELAVKGYYDILDKVLVREEDLRELK